jgi:hypothetical protein
MLLLLLLLRGAKEARQVGSELHWIRAARSCVGDAELKGPAAVFLESERWKEKRARRGRKSSCNFEEPRSPFRGGQCMPLPLLGLWAQTKLDRAVQLQRAL